MTMIRIPLLLLLLLMMMMMMTDAVLSDSSDLIESVQSAFPDRDGYTLLMMLAVMCGACLVGILLAVVHVIRPPPLFTLRSARTSNGADQCTGPALKLFDRIEEFH